MDVREKLVELLKNNREHYLATYIIKHRKSYEEYTADHLLANGVTVQEDCKACAESTQNCIVKLQEQIAELRSAQEWISVKDRLPKIRDDGFADAFLVTDGSLAHIAYFVDGEWIFTDNGEMKQPMFYDVTHWCYLPQPPKGE